MSQNRYCRSIDSSHRNQFLSRERKRKKEDSISLFVFTCLGRMEYETENLLCCDEDQSVECDERKKALNENGTTSIRLKIFWSAALLGFVVFELYVALISKNLPPTTQETKLKHALIPNDPPPTAQDFQLKNATAHKFYPTESPVKAARTIPTKRKRSEFSKKASKGYSGGTHAVGTTGDSSCGYECLVGSYKQEGYHHILAPSAEIFMWSSGHVTAADHHLFVDGISRSSHLVPIDDATRFISNGTTVWMGVFPNKGGFARGCDELLPLVSRGVEARKKQRVSGGENTWHIFMNTFRDHSIENFTCPEIESAVTNSTDEGIVLHYAQRSIVKDRRWKGDLDWVETGTLMNGYSRNVTTLPIPSKSGAPDRNIDLYRHHLNYPVRTDTIDMLKQRIRHICHKSNLSDSIETTCDRSLDLVHFWRHSGDKNKNYSRLRMKVSEVLYDDYCETTIDRTTGADTIKHPFCFIGITGPRGKTGRNEVSPDYIDTMLRSKIIVLSQRTSWEDHWRFFEAMVAGAMVMTDSMISLPEGYEDGVSVVEYGSAEELLAKLEYYLEHEAERLSIAREGRKLAMAGFRSWHMMERLVFGKVLTTTTEHD